MDGCGGGLYSLHFPESIRLLKNSNSSEVNSASGISTIMIGVGVGKWLISHSELHAIQDGRMT